MLCQSIYLMVRGTVALFQLEALFDVPLVLRSSAYVCQMLHLAYGNSNRVSL
jgi:hypothetical protein